MFGVGRPHREGHGLASCPLGSVGFRGKGVKRRREEANKSAGVRTGIKRDPVFYGLFAHSL